MHRIIPKTYFFQKPVIILRLCSGVHSFLYTFFAKSNSAHVLYCSPFPLVFDPFYDIIYKLVLRLIRGAVGEGVDHDMIIAGLLLQPYH